MSMQENPFGFGEIARGNAFINREDAISLVLELVGGRSSHSVALVGVSHSGKSSVLKEPVRNFVCE